MASVCRLVEVGLIQGRRSMGPVERTSKTGPTAFSLGHSKADNEPPESSESLVGYASKAWEVRG